MNIFISVFLLMVGFVLLIKASDIFVSTVSSIASHFKMSKMMIALTVAAFGTCAPELAISFNSLASMKGDIALANVIGSNIVNILLVIGISSLIAPIKVKDNVIKKELPILLIITSLFSVTLVIQFLFNKALVITRINGLLFLSFFVLFITYIIKVVKKKRGLFERGESKYKLSTSILLLVISCIVIVFASDLVVENATFLATTIKISTKIMTMTVMVIGTSLPEMVMTSIAAKRGEFDIALGNIIGTNIFNIGVVLGLPVLLLDGFVAPNFNLIDIFAVLIAALVLYLFAKNDKVLSRKEGIIMITILLVYYSYIIFL